MHTTKSRMLPWNTIKATAADVRAAMEQRRTDLARAFRTDLESVLPSTDERWAKAQEHHIDREVKRLLQLPEPTEVEIGRLDGLLVLSQKRQMLRAIESLEGKVTDA